LKSDGSEDIVKTTFIYKEYKDGGSIKLQAEPIEIQGAQSNGNYINYKTTIVENDFSNLSKSTMKEFKDQISNMQNKVVEGNSPLIISHEIGHSLHLEHNSNYTAGYDGTNNLFDPNGVMTKGPKGPPTATDLMNAIKSAFYRTGLGDSRIMIDDATLKKMFPSWQPDIDSQPSTRNVNVSLEKKDP
jgi:hypothetical protein